MIDIVAGGFDAGIRLTEAVPQDMVAVPFGGSLRFAVVGSPDYFTRHKPPRAPSDLLAHACVRMRMPSGVIYHWEFERHGEAVRIDVDGVLTLDEPDLMLQAARAGLGLAYLTEWNVEADLQAGTLVRVLEPWTPPLNGVSLYYPSRRHAPAGLRALIEMIREQAAVERQRGAQKPRPAATAKPRRVPRSTRKTLDKRD